MGSLTAKGPFGTLLPVRIASMSLTEAEAAAVTWVAPLKGRAAEVSKLLADAIGAGLPEAGGTVTGKTSGKASGRGAVNAARVVWAGPGQVFVIGPALGPVEGAATVDHSSAWARMVLEGDGADGRDGGGDGGKDGVRAAEVLARLVAVDLRDAAFAVGRTARTQLGHMACSLTRTGPDRYEIMVFRSMAATAVHEVTRAMEMVAARAQLAE